MSTWLFDLGNTRLKAARLDAQGGLQEQVAIAHGEGDAWLQQLPHGEEACIASVASAAIRTALFDALASRFTRLHRVHTERRLGPLQIAYPQPANLGVDRFLTLLAIAGQQPALVVGVGTAITVDLIDADGLHRGGRIAPSPALMRQSLHARAVQLPPTGGEYAEFADDTDHALVSGCEGAALALIERSLQQAQALLGRMPGLVLHGGGASSLRERLPAHAWQPDAVLRGLARWRALRIA